MLTVGTPVEVGDSVQARVLDVVKADRIVDLTVRPELLQVNKHDSTKKKEKNKKVFPFPHLIIVVNYVSICIR